MLWFAASFPALIFVLSFIGFSFPRSERRELCTVVAISLNGIGYKATTTPPSGTRVVRLRVFGSTNPRTRKSWHTADLRRGKRHYLVGAVDPPGAGVACADGNKRARNLRKNQCAWVQTVDTISGERPDSIPACFNLGKAAATRADGAECPHGVVILVKRR